VLFVIKEQCFLSKADFKHIYTKILVNGFFLKFFLTFFPYSVAALQRKDLAGGEKDYAPLAERLPWSFRCEDRYLLMPLKLR
jgi:hypothetical protein